MRLSVSVVVICYNEEENIGGCLSSILEQDCPKEFFEVIVVDGGSIDNTHTIVSTQVKECSALRLVCEKKRGAAAARNRGVKEASSELVAFIDADCVAPSDWLTSLISRFEKESVRDPAIVAVGGANIPPPDSKPFIIAVSVALNTYIGSFNSPQGRRFGRNRYVNSLANLNVVYKKNAIQDVGGYDENLMSDAEDAELNHRLKKAGWKLLFVPEIVVFHRFRSSFWSWFKNMFRYGRGRARLLKRYPEMWRPCFILPPLFLIAITSGLLAVFHPLFFLPYLYFPLIMIISFCLCKKAERYDLVLFVSMVFVAQHFGYALGETYGLLSKRIK